MILLKNKLLFILLLFLILTFSLLSSSFALTTNDTITFHNPIINEDCQIILPNDFGTEGFNFYVFAFKGTNPYLYVSNYPFLFGDLGGEHIFVTDGAECYTIKSLTGSTFGLGSFGNGDKYSNLGFHDNILDLSGSTIFYEKTNTSSFNRVFGHSGGTFIDYYDLIITNYTIYDKDTNEEVFQPAPPQEEIVQVEPLKEITQVGEILPAIMKIVEIVLPIFLIIFGTLLVLYLIKSKNLLHL